ncbi:hypothetical protein [Nocardia nova]|uniref:hypothetical protein n=1 Tax=Nocardia nova TaxID=37330 RepID=UPI000CEA6C79|nr:hypothetical protein [Nocardia nova]PPI94514.1 hypothetical protein C5E46_21495 [Nocardia nova]
MDRRQLAAALLAAGKPPQWFQIAGVHTHDPLPTDFWFLRPGSSGDWEVGVFERGEYDVRGRFAAESDAAAWVYESMMGHPPP